MTRSSAAQQHLAPLTQTPGYPDDLLCDLQTTLAALADIDVRYHSDREQLQAWAGPEAIKARFAAQLEERHQREREPNVQRLAHLHHRTMIIMAL